MTNSTNDVLEKGIQEVARLSQRITTLAEQEQAFQGTAASLNSLLETLQAIRGELEKLDAEREKRKWLVLWICLGAVGFLQLVSLALILVKL